MSKKLSYTTIGYFLCRTFFIGIAFSALVKQAKQDSWITILIASIIGIIPAFFIGYIASYESEKTLKEKIKILFPKCGKFIILFMAIGILLLSAFSFWNLSNLITSQFLSKTPKVVIGISFIIPITLLLNKGDKVICRVSVILFYLSGFLFLISLLGLVFQFQFSNFKPTFQNPILSPVFSYLGFQILPIFLLLFFPNKEIQKSIKSGVALSSFILFINTILLIGVLGTDLAIIYQYPEFHILKRAYQGVLTYRLENALSVQWIFDIFIYCVVSMKGCNQLLNLENSFKKYILPIIMLFLSVHMFKDNTIANTITDRYLSFLVPTFFILLILILSTKIFYKKKKKETSS